MNQVFENIFRVAELRNKIFFIVALLVVFRVAANIPLPGVDIIELKKLMSSNEFFGLLNVFSGGGLSNISIVLMGVAPYITASIIMQLMTTIVPKLEKLYKEEGEIGRQKFNMWTRWLTVPLAAVQSFGMITLLRSQNILGVLSTFDLVVFVVSSTAGTIFLMWLGELITEKGLGNGVSIMIFAGIVADLPSSLSRAIATYDPSQIFTYTLFAAVALVTVAGVIFINEGQRTIPVSYAKRVRGAQVYGGAATHLPLKVNQAGVIPIIFAVSLILLPTMAANYFIHSAQPMVSALAEHIARALANQWLYGGMYFVLVIVFTYFYTAVIFDPVKISENLQKQGGYIPGIRPGATTAEYLYRIINRITLAGSLFLGLIAVLPIVVQGLTGIQALAVGGVSILIVVSVVLELVKHIQSQLMMRSYDHFR